MKGSSRPKRKAAPLCSCGIRAPQKERCLVCDHPLCASCKSADECMQCANEEPNNGPQEGSDEPSGGAAEEQVPAMTLADLRGEEEKDRTKVRRTLPSETREAIKEEWKQASPQLISAAMSCSKCHLPKWQSQFRKDLRLIQNAVDCDHSQACPGECTQPGTCLRPSDHIDRRAQAAEAEAKKEAKKAQNATKITAKEQKKKMVLERVAAIKQDQQRPFNSATLAIAGKGSVTPLLKPRVTIDLDADDECDDRSYQPIVEPRNDLHGRHLPAGFEVLTPEDFMELAADLQQDHANQLQALKLELEAQKLESAAMEESKNATNRRLRAAYGDEKRLREEAERELEHFRQLPPQQPWERLANEREELSGATSAGVLMDQRNEDQKRQRLDNLKEHLRLKQNTTSSMAPPARIAQFPAMDQFKKKPNGYFGSSNSQATKRERDEFE